MTRSYKDVAAVKFRWSWLARLAVAARLGLLAQGLWCTYSPWTVRRG